MLPVKTITEHAHNLYRMSSNLRSIAYDLHYCPGSKNYRRQNKMTFFPELYIKVITKLPNSEQSYKGKVKTHNYINRQNQSTTGKL